MANDLIGTTYKLKASNVKYRVYDVLNDAKNYPHDGEIVYLALVRNTRVFGSDQQFISIPFRSILQFFEPAGSRLEP